ncbi:TetR family transcriptional regulator [Nocardioides sp. cx-169]|uniref:TetR/AcrR family transcriptional regulator n=1 Tax=Nocardioides sp. cx-169 TaxID=2899080 RepID=UPI001E2C4387|nr:TetR/AcrR family transcriptional regulator [Nocardioides sp. cx-169]MCD4532826.1 TetR family transcriptional regulator [Nocardioides sp. cx-169]
MPRPDVRQPLLDAAERLFAARGISTVSDRQVAEAAHNSNHSAVRYYFGGRTGLLEALLDRHAASVEPAQQRMFAQSDSLLGDVRALVIPVTDALDELPFPSYRARFLRQAMHDPTTAELMRDRERFAASTRIVASAAERLASVDPRVIRGRARLTAHVVSTACAQIEEDAERTGERPRWSEVGAFLCDAVAGMLQAPVSTT